MEKSGIKSKNRLLKLASSAVSFQNPPFSPNREKAQARKGFSGPMIPPEARHKSKNSSYISHEPTSPKVSCMGQIKHKKKLRDLNNKKVKLPDSLPPRDDHHFISYSTPLEQVNPSKNHKPKIFKSFQSFTEVKKKNPAPVLKSVQSFNHEEIKKKKNSAIRKIFGKASKRNYYEPPLTAPAEKSSKAPKSLGQLQRFSSGRNSLSNFDWTTAQISPAEHDDESDGEWDEEDAKISFSAPIGMGSCVANVEPRKEINLWKRRTMPQPKPLQLNT